MIYLGRYSVTIERCGRFVTAPMKSTTFGWRTRFIIATYKQARSGNSIWKNDSLIGWKHDSELARGDLHLHKHGIWYDDLNLCCTDFGVKILDVVA